MALVPGVRPGPYEVTAQIGVGGMGEVYRAADAERLARFQREAEVLAALISLCQITVLQPQRTAVLVQGGEFFPEPASASLDGCSFGGSPLIGLKISVAEGILT